MKAVVRMGQALLVAAVLQFRNSLAGRGAMAQGKRGLLLGARAVLVWPGKLVTVLPLHHPKERVQELEQGQARVIVGAAENGLLDTQ